MLYFKFKVSHVVVWLLSYSPPQSKTTWLLLEYCIQVAMAEKLRRLEILKQLRQPLNRFLWNKDQIVS